ncbi:branched-chain amino acid ABC transporter permease [Peterkaempfera bronchialis]|uniref:Branched-chain amino acid ABC transporter permease n=1 Tax=Peterkaempfera bronchialis TaxID=2126346 RepID=A0A345SS17_9ACTN|nr:branched-chain amino acid ABC transporter permease [Peterkaempfera bronchialis]AXI76522.1 branched-chain amino acid ABC transporter permease [Peterkaempfera bronchialis]
MIRLLEALVNGVSLGALYSLIALGFVIIYRATGVLNFAHGAFLLAGTYVTAEVAADHGFPLGLLAGLAAGAALGAVTQIVFMRFSRDRSHIGLSVLTLGINILAVTEVTRRIGDRTIPMSQPWGSSELQLGPVTVPLVRMVALAGAAVIISGFLAVFRRTRWGLALRVSAADRETAALMGVRLSRVSGTSWAIGGLMAAVAGLFLASFPSPGVDAGLSNSAMRAFPAAVIGGLDSVGGALLGGLALGVAESLTATYESGLGAFGKGLSGVVAYLVLFAVLLVRPDGFFGRKAVARV